MQSAAALLSRRPHRPAPEVTLGDAEIALRLGRVHELCGPARHTLALALAARAGGPVIWLSAQTQTETLCADALAEWINPAEILFVEAEKRDMLLWAMEEALRDGHAPVVIADLAAPPGMVPIRRLHLAAEAGCGVGVCRPLALLLTPEEGGAPGIETRWALNPAHHEGRDHWKIQRLRARMAPPRDWLMTRTSSGLVPCADKPSTAQPALARHA
jgi:protein ImuA